MQPATILIVDDEESLRATMSKMLQRQDYNVITAEDYRSGMQALGENKIHVAILDVRLPDVSGVELLKAIAQRDEYIPVIIMTGEPDIADVPEIIRAGASDYLPKPIRRADLIRVVEQTVEKKITVDERTQALQKTTNFLNTLLDSCTNLGVIAWDTEGRINAFNRGAKSMFGCSAEKALGKQVAVDLKLFGDLSIAELHQRCRASISEGPLEWEQVCRTCEGQPFDGMLTVNPMRDENGQVIGFLCLVKDVTEIKKTAEEINDMRRKLINSEKIAALGRMSAHVAHEVKNPLGGLKLYASSLKRKLEASDGSDRLELADKICKGIDHLNNVVNGITKFAQPPTLNKSRVHVNRLLEDALALLQHQIQAKEITVKKALDEQIPDGLFDESTLKSTVLNLLINAIQAVNWGGVIKAETRRILPSAGDTGGAGLVIEIKDNGCGMTEEQLANIFEPFFTTKNQGLGLGMTYVQNVIHMHNGSIHIESHRGEGTCVQIRLPLAG